MKKDIIIVDDEKDIRELISGILSDEGFETRLAKDIDSLKIELIKRVPSLILLDVWLDQSNADGIDILKVLKKSYPYIPVIMISGHGTIDMAINALKIGAFDFIEKPFKAERLILLIEKALQDRNLKLKVLDFELKENERMSLIGKSSIFKNIKQKLNKIASTNSRVLINGPSGSGKELMARWIHKKSERGSFPFIVASCATLSPERVEQVLFGWNEVNSENKNNQSNIGLFEQANYGTLFFDEICDLPLQTQGKLVQAIQDQSFYKIGSNKKINVDVRIISASNNNLAEFIQNGTLRQDLFYRLSVAPIEVPPLNKRGEDIADLIVHFLNLLARDFGNSILKISSETLVILKNYDWPGNVRQLKNILEWLNIMYGKQKDFIISPSHLPPEILGYNKKEENIHNSNHLSLSLKDARKVFEKNYLKEQLKRFKGSIAKTSSFIGMDRSALHRKLKELDININNFD